MFSTLYSDRGQYHTKYGEIGVFCGAQELRSIYRKIKLELNKFGI